MGATITTDSRTSNLVVALLAILSSLGTAHMWNIATFLIHQLRYTERPSYVVLQQQQALLRTQPSPSSFVVDSLKLCWSWKRKHGAGFLMVHSMPLALLGLLFAAATVVAGIFSSYVISSVGIEVLVDSPGCGLANLHNMSRTKDTERFGAILGSYVRTVKVTGVSLAKACYGNNTEYSRSCDVFTKSRIIFNASRDSCLWNATLCRPDTTPALTLDSGLVDMRSAFGFNLPPGSGVKYRTKATCAVLPTEHTRVETMEEFGTWFRPALPNEEVMLFNYGTTSGLKNNTFALSLLTSNITSSFLMM